ncbi:bacitracin resistance protein BacA [Leptospira perolatii]|uniref:Bacitracin resistance protein BacA n=1 Tax=Leptospira perolatii TaxID=2023191 RepID=A0A2M9ZS06_9LEPT|nr:bacitracin resistance protein BacA [Leptospira perolatii]PJZ71344.1 bacitracin resistance protein BacA [Leptospira perolatii]PJZ74878.1 bacitracin resistance protein BacA [Leptospira perolatii]
MNQDQFFLPSGGPPEPDPRLRSLYSILGEEKIRKLVFEFYKRIESSSIRSMFPPTLEESEEKSADFLIQVLGGPPLYVQKHGPPRMRARHFPFPIDEKARRIWLSCYREALRDWEAETDEKEILWKFLESFSAWMVNTSTKSE